MKKPSPPSKPFKIYQVNLRTGPAGNKEPETSIVPAWEAAHLWYIAARHHMEDAEAAAKNHRRRKFISTTNLAIEALTHANKNIEALLPR